MTTLDLVALAAILEPRIVKGAALLFEMEQAGERDARYDRWVRNYTRMVVGYSILTERISQGTTSIDAVAPSPPPAEPDLEQTPLLLGETA